MQRRGQSAGGDVTARTGEAQNMRPLTVRICPIVAAGERPFQCIMGKLRDGSQYIVLNPTAKWKSYEVAWEDSSCRLNMATQGNASFPEEPAVAQADERPR
jgi:hypothetical protein